ncbi:MAG: tetratricopeptide repeat protein [Proteobacteria bacterium]|nr:tetratricopeptide repeat protein [Pseudomonadota bacterium]
MWNGYSTREAAEVIGLSESIIRGCVRAGFVEPDSSGVSMRFSFRDLRILKSVKELIAGGIPLKRIRRQLSALQKRLPARASLAELSLAAHGGDVVVREQNGAWRADTGQLVLLFDGGEKRGQLHSMPIRREAPGPEVIAATSADEWLDRAVTMEEFDTARAIEAYQRALVLRPDAMEGWINLGRLYAESGQVGRARDCFRRALALDPTDATTIYNLGVVAQDAGRDDEAVSYYQRALRIEPMLAEAHYNLATIYDRQGDATAAIRHINEYRKLMQKQR